MPLPAAPHRSSCRGSAAVELLLTMAFLLMGILASINFSRQYHAHAKAMEEARTNSSTSATHSNKNLFAWVGSAYSKPNADDLGNLGKTDTGAVSSDAGDPGGTGQKPPEFDLGKDAKEGSAEYGVFGFLVGEVDTYEGKSAKSLKGIYLLDPATVSKAGTTDIGAQYVVCRECYKDSEPEKERGWLTIDTLGWLTNSVSGLVKGLVSWMLDIDTGDVVDLLSPIPLGGWDFNK